MRVRSSWVRGAGIATASDMVHLQLVMSWHALIRAMDGHYVPLVWLDGGVRL